MARGAVIHCGDPGLGVIALIVHATAPSRIDLAGGALDIYPLYLFEEGGITINMGISLGSHVWLQTRQDAQVAEGAQHLPYKINHRGLSVRVIGEQRRPSSQRGADPLTAQTVRFS